MNSHGAMRDDTTPKRPNNGNARLAALVTVLLFGCGGGPSMRKAPVASLGQSIAAQQQFKVLEQAWLEGTERDHHGLEPRLTTFIQRFPKDPESHLVQVWLARLHLEKGKLDDAWALAEQASVEQVGSAFDAAQVAKAAVLTRRGQPERSLGILEPLSGKITDSRERDTWAREIIRATLQLKHDDYALKWALVWRLESSEDRRASIDREIGLVLDQVSELALDRLWNQLVAAERLPTTNQSRRQGRLWMRDAVLQRLARSAITRRDGNLARRLLNDAWMPLQKSGDVRRLTRVAAQGQTEVQNLARSIGVVLELDDTKNRRRSSELVTGILQTLDEHGDHPSVRLQTREARDRSENAVADAVEDLCNEGVTILVGGFEGPSAIELVKTAATKGVAAIALSEVEVKNELTFWFDTSDNSVVETWKKAEPKSQNSSKVITDSDAECANSASEPAVRWNPQGFERILVNATSSCADVLGQSVVNGPRLPQIWLGAKSLNAADSWPDGTIKGQFNFQRLLETKQRAQDLEQWEKRFARLPSYYEVMGHDVAVLAAASLDEFPASVGMDSSSRTSALRDVAIRLSSVHTTLWSTTAQGFGPNHGIIPEFRASSDNAPTSGSKDQPPRK